MNKITIIPFLAIIAMSISLAGCATPPDEISAAYASPLEFQELNCSQIELGMTRRSRRLSELYAQLDDEAETDEMQTAIGLMIFFPALFFLEGGDDERASEYARLRGEMAALEDVGVGKECAGLEAYRFKKPTEDDSTDTESSTQ